MRKGLVTLGVVALVLAVSPGFAEAPILSCMPDVTVSDVEQNSQTADSNLFIFSDALDLDEYVSDGDTADNLLRWSFIQTSGPALELNGIASNPAVDTLEPGADDLRQVSNLLTIANVDWMGVDPGTSAPADSMVEMYVSDGTTVSQASMKVTTVNAANDVGDPDAVLPAELANYGFDAGAEGWTWFEITVVPDIGTVPHAASGGALTITENTPHDQIMYGAYESPRDPAVALMPKLGCVMRARYQISSSATDQTCPGFRLRGLTSHVSNAGGTWEQDFANEDYTSFNQVQFSTIDFAFAGNADLLSRIPGAGQTYTLMLFPRQISETLLSNDPLSPMVHYVTVDLLDLEGQTSLTGNADAGTLTVDSVVIDGIDRPEIGTGTAVPGMTFTDFSTGWATGVGALAAGASNQTGLVASTGADLTITVAPGNDNFQVYCEMATGIPLDSGRTYRLAFMCTSSEAPTGDAGPLVRTNLTSSAFVYSAVLELQGGALLSRLTSTPSLMELWVEAPSEVGAGSGTTEEMKAQFLSYLAQNVAQWPFFRAVSGTVTCTELTTEVFDF